MRSLLRTLAGASTALLLTLAPAALAAPPAPERLRVEGEEARWHPDNDFRLDWGYGPGTATTTAVRYQVRDLTGAIVVPQRQVNWAATFIEDLMVPDRPGIYIAEVWLVNSLGEEGPPATAKLRFDNTRPIPLEALRIPPWLGRSAFPFLLTLRYPFGTLPASGIDGYAIELDESPATEPCSAFDRCAGLEIDLRDGLEGNTLRIPSLAEGTAYLHAVAVSGSGMKSALPVHGQLRVDLTDPETRLGGVPAGWTSEAVTLTAIASDERSGMKGEAGGPTPFTALRVDGGLPRTSAGGSVSATVFTEGVHRIDYYARDAAGNVNDGGTTNGVPNPPPDTAVVRIDRSAPAVAFAGSDPSDPELLHVHVVDPLSGPDLRRGSIAVRPAGSTEPFVELPTAPSPDGFQARWTSEAYPPGEYEFRAVGYDAAGNSTLTLSRADGAKMALGNPLKQVSVLQAALGAATAGPQCSRRRGERRCKKLDEAQGQPSGQAVAYGRRVMLSGRLADPAGAPLPGMEIRVLERFATGAGPVERVSTATTGSDGGFSLHLAAGPSREVTATFNGTRTVTRSTISPLHLAVRTKVALGVSASTAKVGGAPVVFRGRVSANEGEIPAGGKSVQLQFRATGLPWSEFRTVQTDRDGRFRYAYRFSDDDSRGVRFQFRAFVPAQGDWPYEPGGSRPVAVQGR